MSANDYEDETELRREGPARLFRCRPEISWTDEAGSHRHLLTRRTTVGSAAGTDLRVADREVSRLHAELEPVDHGTWVRDLGSRNGTFVQGLQVSAALAPDGARVRLGKTELVLRYPTAPSPVELWPHPGFGGLLGASPAMRELYVQMAGVAKSEAPALIQGETGTGKELAARALHDASARAAGPFVIVDCAALSSSLVEAELFGHARGAFTGATGARAGAFEAADGGSVFLDEIGELPLPLQPKLLRALESQMVKRLGETEHRRVNVRLIAATHRDLRQMVNAGAFREDLYFRLAVLPLVLPPLRERPTDIPPLYRHFLRGRQPLAAVSDRELMEMPWLGNVRELRNFVERACALGASEVRVGTTANGAARARSETPGGTALPVSSGSEGLPDPAVQGLLAGAGWEQPFKEFRERWIDEGERQYVTKLLERNRRNVAAAADEAGLDRTYVYRLIRKHNL